MNMIRIASKVGSWTIISRIAGYVRDMFMAQVLGASAAAEAFQIAFTFPNLFRNLFGEGAMNAALIPHFNTLDEREGRIVARQFLGDVMLLVGGLMLLITALAYVFMAEIVAVFAWGFTDPDKIQLTIELARICLPYLFCVIIAAIFSGILNCAGKFSVPAAVPIVLNIMMISPLAAAVLGWIDFAVQTLAWAVVAGGCLQLLLCVIAAWHIGYLPIFRHRLMNAEIRAFGNLLLPGILSALFLQCNLITTRAFASTLPEGSIIWLFFADRLFQLPLALIGISLGIALLPAFSRVINSGDTERADNLRNQTQQAALLLAVPSAIGLAICAEEIINILFVRGAFSASDARQTVLALQVLVLGLPAYILVKVLQPLFFAHHDTKTPMQIAAVMMVFNIALAFVLMQFFAHSGLALALAVSGWLQCVLLVLALRKRRIAALARGILTFSLKVLLAGMTMAGCLYGTMALIPEMHAGLELLVLLSVGGCSYLVAATALTGYKWRQMFDKENE